MTNGKEQEAQAGVDKPAEEPDEGNSLRDASDEAVRFMEESDEPGHAGRGDGG